MVQKWNTERCSDYFVLASHSLPSASIFPIDLRGRGLPVLRHSYRFTRSSEAAKNHCYLFHQLRECHPIPLRNHGG